MNANSVASGQTLLPSKVLAAIETALEDEYRAEAFYGAVIKKFGEVRPFVNIIDAERRHARRLEGLLASHGAPIPENPYVTGAASPPAVPETLSQACRMGVEAEIENAALYAQQLLPAVAGYSDVEQAMNDLMSASQENHLPAFQRCLDRSGRGGRGRGYRGGGRGA